MRFSLCFWVHETQALQSLIALHLHAICPFLREVLKCCNLRNDTFTALCFNQMGAWVHNKSCRAFEISRSELKVLTASVQGRGMTNYYTEVCLKVVNSTENSWFFGAVMRSFYFQLITSRPTTSIFAKTLHYQRVVLSSQHLRQVAPCGLLNIIADCFK